MVGIFFVSFSRGTNFEFRVQSHSRISIKVHQKISHGTVDGTYGVVSLWFTGIALSKYLSLLWTLVNAFAEKSQQPAQLTVLRHSIILELLVMYSLGFF